MEHIKKHLEEIHETTAEHIQTASAHVFLVDNKAYKFCKPVDFGFLVLTQKKQRENHIRNEFERNKAFTPDLYIDTTSVLDEPCIVMRRMQTKDIAKNKVEILNSAHMKILASTVFDAHYKAKTNKTIQEFGSLQQITHNWKENFEQTKQAIGVALSQEDFTFIENKILTFIKQNGKLLQDRQIHVKHNHGDLHLENIFIYDDKAYLFDALSFNMRFPCCDTASEVAFLAMDLEAHQKQDHAHEFVTQYIQHAQDDSLHHVLDFYKCYRAYIRAKIAWWNYAESKDLDSVKKWFNHAKTYAQRM